MITKLFFLIFLIARTLLSFESFGNNTVEVPLIGVLFLDNSPLKHKKPLGIERQYSIGVAYGRSIDNKKFFWQTETQAAFGPISHSSKLTLANFMVGSGIRYYFFDEGIKPFVDLKLNYLHFLGNATTYLTYKTDVPIWIGLMPTLGLQWLFMNEMALSLSLSIGFYVNISESFRHTIDTKLSYVIYF